MATIKGNNRIVELNKIDYQLEKVIVNGNQILPYDNFASTLKQQLNSSDSQNQIQQLWHLLQEFKDRTIVAHTGKQKQGIKIRTNWRTQVNGRNATSLDVVESANKILKFLNITQLGGNIEVAVLLNADFRPDSDRPLPPPPVTFVTGQESTFTSNELQGFRKQVEIFSNLAKQSNIQQQNAELYFSHFENYLNQIAYFDLSGNGNTQIRCQIYRKAGAFDQRLRDNIESRGSMDSLAFGLYGNNVKNQQIIAGRFHEPFLLHVIDSHPNDYKDFSKQWDQPSWTHGFKNFWNNDTILNQIFSTVANSDYGSYGGDIIISDSDGNITYNIQSKIARLNRKTYNKSLQSLLRSVYRVSNELEEIIKTGIITDKQIKKIYDYFAINALQPVTKSGVKSILSQKSSGLTSGGKG